MQAATSSNPGSAYCLYCIQRTPPALPLTTYKSRPRGVPKNLRSFDRTTHPILQHTNMDTQSTPRVLSVSLNYQEFFEETYASLLDQIKAKSSFERAEDKDTALRLIRESPAYTAILVTDEALTLRKNKTVWDAVLKYVRQGGRAVVMGHFSSFVKPLDIKPFFEKAGLQWESGSYHREVLVLNHDAVPSTQVTELAPQYSQKAVFLDNVQLTDAWYITDNGNTGNAHVTGESPVVMASVGNGKLGYLGDVNAEKESDVVILAMCGL